MTRELTGVELEISSHDFLQRATPAARVDADLWCGRLATEYAPGSYLEHFGVLAVAGVVFDMAEGWRDPGIEERAIAIPTKIRVYPVTDQGKAETVTTAKGRNTVEVVVVTELVYLKDPARIPTSVLQVCVEALRDGLGR